MIVTIPPRIKPLCGRSAQRLTEKKRHAVAWLPAGVLLVRGARSRSELARAVLERARGPGRLSRRMRRESFRAQDMVRSEMKRRVTPELWRAEGREEV